MPHVSYGNSRLTDRPEISEMFASVNFIRLRSESPAIVAGLRQHGLQARSDERAFSLVEVLVAVSVMCLMMSLLVPAFTEVGKGAQLNSSGNLVANLINLARENSMSRNVMTALVVLTDTSIPNANRALILMELDPRSDGTPVTSADWKPVTKWETLGSGAIVDKLVSFQTTAPQPAFPTLTYGISTASAYSYIIFLPGGSLLNGGPSQIRVAEGYYATGQTSPVYTTRKAANGDPINYYNIAILGATGRTKIDRP